MIVDMRSKRVGIALPIGLEHHLVSGLRAFEEASDIECRIGRKESTDAGKYVFTFTLDRKVEGTYPVTLVSYQIACTKYDSADKAALVKALYSYIISPEGQDAAAKNAGSAPISDTLRQQIQPAVDAIGSGS